MKAFVTGATGFIGGHVARKLRERGDDVVALVRSPGKAGGPEERLVRMSISDSGMDTSALTGIGSSMGPR